MQFQVPQFIEVEDKIIGPLTGKQFFYLLGAAAIIFLLRVVFEWWVVIILGGPFAGLAIAMAFLKVNGVPFIKVMNNAVNYFFSNKLYLWKKSQKPSSSKSYRDKDGSSFFRGDTQAAPKLTENRLQDLAWSLDIQHKPLSRNNK
jgi:hypothetical protein